jgi:hypothetical protein
MESKDFIKWNELATGSTCFICDKTNQSADDEDNVCDDCCVKWKYEEYGELGEGYYKVFPTQK